MGKAEGLTVATVGANRLQAEALPSLLAQYKVIPDTLLAFADHPGALELALDEAGAQVFLPLEREVVGQADAVFLFSGVPGVRETLAEWAASENFWLLDLTDDPSGPWRSPILGAAALQKGGALLAVPEMDAWCCAALAGALGPAAKGTFFCNAFRPASTRGETGVEELYRQAVAALNFKEGPREVFGKLLAFNLLPNTPSAREVAAFTACLRALAGPEVTAVRAVMGAPLFHASALSVLVEVDNPVSAAKKATAALKKAGFAAARGTAWPLPLDEAGRAELRFRLAPADAGHLWAWFVYDELKAGKMALGAALLAALAGTR